MAPPGKALARSGPLLPKNYTVTRLLVDVTLARILIALGGIATPFRSCWAFNQRLCHVFRDLWRLLLRLIGWFIGPPRHPWLRLVPGVRRWHLAAGAGWVGAGSHMQFRPAPQRAPVQSLLKAAGRGAAAVRGWPAAGLGLCWPQRPQQVPSPCATPFGQPRCCESALAAPPPHPPALLPCSQLPRGQRSCCRWRGAHTGTPTTRLCSSGGRCRCGSSAAAALFVPLIIEPHTKALR